MIEELILDRSYYPKQEDIFAWCKKNCRGVFRFENTFGSTFIYFSNHLDKRALQTWLKKT